MVNKVKHKEGRGVLQKMEFKKIPTFPDYLGSCTINGQSYQIAGWINSSPELDEVVNIVIQTEEEAERIRKEKRAAKVTPQTHPNSMENQF